MDFKLCQAVQQSLTLAAAHALRCQWFKFQVWQEGLGAAPPPRPRPAGERAADHTSMSRYSHDIKLAEPGQIESQPAAGGTDHWRAD
jgi:hypothetical protein